MHDRDAAIPAELHSVQQRTGQTQFTQAALLVNASSQFGRRDTCIRDLSTDIERSCCNVRVAERSCVCQDRDIEEARDLGRQWDPKPHDDIEDHLSAGRRSLVEPIDHPVHHVADVMVDVDDDVPVQSGDLCSVE